MEKILFFGASQVRDIIKTCNSPLLTYARGFPGARIENVLFRNDTPKSRSVKERQKICQGYICQGFIGKYINGKEVRIIL